MAKSCLIRRTHQGTAVMANTVDYVCQTLKSTEKQYGRDGHETLQVCLLLGAIYDVLEEYEKAEPVLTRCAATANGNRALNAREMLWASSLLAEAYFKQGRIREGLLVTSEGKSIPRIIDSSAEDPLLERFLQLALSLKTMGILQEFNRDLRQLS